jgi:hypothetical protein
MFFVFLFAGAILLAAFRKSSGEGITLLVLFDGSARLHALAVAAEAAVTGLDRKHEASLAGDAAAEYRPAAQEY